MGNEKKQNDLRLLRLVHDRYKHMSSLFEKDKWFYETSDTTNPFLTAACDMWEAIKETIKEADKKT